MSSPDNERGLGEAMSEALEKQGTKVADIKLLARAAREGWAVPEKARAEAGVMLLEILETKTTTVTDNEGKPLEVSNARNQIAAARALATFDAINQTDYWNADKNARIDAGQATERVALDPVILRQPVKPE